MSVNGLEKITERILADANEQKAKILAGAADDCKRIEADASAKIAALKAEAEAKNAQKQKDLLARAKASASMKARNLLMSCRAELLAEVFENAKKSVLQMDRAEYAELLAGLVASCVCDQVKTEEENRKLYGEEEEITPASYEIILCPKDRKELGKTVLEGAKKKLSGVLAEERVKKLALSEKTANIEGGIILKYGDIEANASLEMLFSELHREAEGEVSQILFGEKKA